ncbi:MAG TPA: RNA 3'-terminal phosphate cyclase, partial [Verrucomicrobiae bacterium]|nr:RNA 3'-terminal phosphate cyclase [Verrucomicrobiae bacterium]
ISGAGVSGAELGSQAIHFTPGVVSPGDYAFAIGTAGSVTLVLQTILPALMQATAPSTVLLEGGTHNPLAPSFEFLDRAFLPLLARIGPKVKLKLDRYGFYPQGWGKIRVVIEPSPMLIRLDLPERGEVRAIRAAIILAHLPDHVAERELRVLRRELHIEGSNLRSKHVQGCTANVAQVEVESDQVTEVFTSFGELGLPAEEVGRRLASEVKKYLVAKVPVGEHLADQLLLPMSLAGGGSFVTPTPTLHTWTNIEVIKHFLPVEISVTPLDGRRARIEIRPVPAKNAC